MKITSVTTHIMGVSGPGGHAPSRNWIFVRVETDRGLIGIGEATTEYHEAAVAAMIEHHFAPLLIGQDPTRINDLWQQMRRGFWWRNGVVESSAASGIDQALWDITGKAYEQPVYKLLGGALRDRVPMYARPDLGLDSYESELQAAMEEGFIAFKLGVGRIVQPFDQEKQVDVALELHERMRRVAGPNIDLMIDCAGIFGPQAAWRLTEGLRSLNPLFVEEPVNADTPRPLIELRRAFPGIRIAAGERVMTRWGFREWLENGAADVIQADICHCGGISELVRVAAYAEIYNVQVAPHNPYGPVALAASLHACATIPNFLILEHCRLRPWFQQVQKEGPVIRSGCLELTDQPGLGVDLDWNYVANHPYRPLNLRLMKDRHGAIPLV